jgi:hypothetical protein
VVRLRRDCTVLPPGLLAYTPGAGFNLTPGRAYSSDGEVKRIGEDKK